MPKQTKVSEGPRPEYDFKIVGRMKDQLIDDLALQRDTLVGHLRALLQVTRVRSVAGYQPMKCMACNRPHPATLRQCTCPHHGAIKFLQGLGYDVKEAELNG